MVFDVPENTCPQGFVYEIEHYVWASQRGAKRALLKNTPEKDNDDLLDPVMQVALVLDSKKRQDVNQASRPEIIHYAGR
jgi:hypothetical protein